MNARLSRLSLFSLALCGFAAGLPLVAQAQSACVPDAPLAGDSVVCEGAGDGIRDDGLDGVTISVATGAVVSNATEIAFELDDDVTLTNDGTISSAGDHAVQLDNGGAITNTGTIESTDLGESDGINADNDTSIINSGTITGTDEGVQIEEDSTVVNSGTITGGDRGIDGEFSGIRITNSGSITGVESDGVRTGADALVENSGTITGGDDGVQVRENSTVINSGTITALAAEGINANRDGVRIENSGTIIGFDDAVNLANDAYVLNTGTILSNGTDQDGVDLDSGTVINHGTIRSLALTDGDGIDFDEGATGAGFVLNTGLIEGARGVNADDLDTQSQTVTNYGTIIGHSGIAISLAGGDDVLELATGSQIIGAIDPGTGTDTFRLLSPVQGAFSFITAPEIFDAGGNPFIASADGLSAVAADPRVMSAGDTLAARGMTSVLGNALELAEGAPGFAALLTSTGERDEMEGVLRYGFELEGGTVLSLIGGLMSGETENMPGGVDVDYSMALVGPAASRDVGAARATVLGFIGTSETEYDAAAHVGGGGTADGTLYGVAGRFSYGAGQLGAPGLDLALSGGIGWHDMGDFSLSTLGKFDGRTPRTGFARVELGQSVELGAGTLRGLVRLTHVSGAGYEFTLRALGGSTSFDGTGLDSDTIGGIGAEYLQPIAGGSTLRLRLVAEGTDEDDMAVGFGIGVTF